MVCRPTLQGYRDPMEVQSSFMVRSTDGSSSTRITWREGQKWGNGIPIQTSSAMLKPNKQIGIVIPFHHLINWFQCLAKSPFQCTNPSLELRNSLCWKYISSPVLPICGKDLPSSLEFSYYKHQLQPSEISTETMQSTYQPEEFIHPHILACTETSIFSIHSTSKTRHHLQPQHQELVANIPSFKKTPQNFLAKFPFFD